MKVVYFPINVITKLALLFSGLSLFENNKKHITKRDYEDYNFEEEELEEDDYYYDDLD